MWGVGPAGPIHFAYDILIHPQLELMGSGSTHTILLADVHVMLTHGLSLSDARRRSYYYETVLRTGYGLECRYTRGSEFQLLPDYQGLLLRLASHIPLNKSKQTLTAATRSATRRDGTKEAATIGSVLYPLMQCIDAAYLGIEHIIADEGQRKTYDLVAQDSRLAHDWRSLVAHRVDDSDVSKFPRKYSYYPLGCDTAGKSLRDSSNHTRLSIHENADSLKRKIKGMYAPPAGQQLAEGRVNAALEYFRFSVLPWLDAPLTIPTRDGAVVVEDFSDLVAAYESGAVHPSDLKEVLFEVLLERTRQMRNRLAAASYDWVDTSSLRT